MIYKTLQLIESPTLYCVTVSGVTVSGEPCNENLATALNAVFLVSSLLELCGALVGLARLLLRHAPVHLQDGLDAARPQEHRDRVELRHVQTPEEEGRRGIVSTVENGYCDYAGTEAK